MVQPKGWEIVFAGSAMEADLIRLHLQENGIEARLHDENVGTWAPYAAASGGAGAVKVAVPILKVAEAQDLIRRHQGQSSSDQS